MADNKAPDNYHFVNEPELRRIEAGHSEEQESLSATNYVSPYRKFHGSSGCSAAGGVRSVTIRYPARSEKGSGMVEYALLLVFMALAVISGGFMLGHTLSGVVGRCVQEMVK